MKGIRPYSLERTLASGRKPLTETLTFQIVAGGVDHSAMFEQLVHEWGESPLAPLAVLCVAVIALGRIHQAHHWQAHGDDFYGDHELYDRLYNDVIPEIDSLGERTIGLGGMELVNPVVQQRQVARLAQVWTASQPVAMPNPKELALSSLTAEMHFLRFVDIAMERLAGELTTGSENLLADIADKHESHVYLLKQRLSSR